MHLSVNSAARAEKGTILIQQVLGDLARAPVTETYTVEQMMAEQPLPGEATSTIPPGKAEQVVHEFLDRQYRQAVKSSAGRQNVADWLKYLENRSAHKCDPNNPMATYSFEWMWRELGVLDLRR